MMCRVLWTLLGIARATSGLVTLHQRAALERVAAVDAWFAGVVNGSAPPAPYHWRVRSPRDLLGGATPLSTAEADAVQWRKPGGAEKEVNASRVDVDGTPTAVVVKAQRYVFRLSQGGESAGRRGRRLPLSGPAHQELLFLEYLRGSAGIPALYGGWATADGPAWVVEDAGFPIGRGKGGGDSPTITSAAYDALATNRPLALARALLACFQSFAGGGFVLSDFHPSQFALRDDGGVVVVSLVDGPAANGGPLAAYVRSAYPTLTRRHRSVPMDARWVLPPPGPCAEDRDCARTKHFHSCSPETMEDGVASCERGTAGPPECAGTCGGGRHRRCGAITAAAHAFDLGGKRWLLPRLAELADDAATGAFLRALASDLRAPEPGDRPTFAAARARVDAFERGNLTS